MAAVDPCSPSSRGRSSASAIPRGARAADGARARIIPGAIRPNFLISGPRPGVDCARSQNLPLRPSFGRVIRFRGAEAVSTERRWTAGRADPISPFDLHENASRCRKRRRARNEQEDLRRQPSLQHHGGGPRGDVRPARSRELRPRDHRPGDRSLARLRIRGDGRPDRGGRGDPRAQRSRHGRPPAARQRGARARGRRRRWRWRGGMRRGPGGGGGRGPGGGGGRPRY